jgi:hypothetical protein
MGRSSTFQRGAEHGREPAIAADDDMPAELDRIAPRLHRLELEVAHEGEAVDPLRAGAS